MQQHTCQNRKSRPPVLRKLWADGFGLEQFKVVGEQWFEWWDVRVLPLNCQPWPNRSKTDHIFLHFWLLQRTSANWDMAKENMF